MVEPLVVSPSGVDAVALGDNAAFEHNGVLVQHDGIGTGEFGRSLSFVRDPRFVGTGFFAGEAPDGLTTVYGDPIPADVFVYWRDPDDPMAQEVLVGATKSALDGTWRITGLNYNLQYVIRARASGRDDVTVVGVQPSRTDVITYEGEFTNTEYFDGAAGEILITSGLPPFTATVIQPLPYGLLPVIDGRKLIIDGVSTDDGEWNSVIRVVASNGPHLDIPVKALIGLNAPTALAAAYAKANDWELSLSWTDNCLFEQGVRVYRSTSAIDPNNLPAPHAVLAANAMTFVDSGLSPGVTYHYRVSVFYEANEAVSAELTRQATWSPRDSAESVGLLLDDLSVVQGATTAQEWRDSIRGLAFTQPIADKRPPIIAAADSDIGHRYLRFGTTGMNLYCASDYTGDMFRNKDSVWMFAVYRRRTTDATPTSRVLFFGPTPSSGTTRVLMGVSSDQTGMANRPLLQSRRLDANPVSRLHAAATPAVNTWLMRFDDLRWSSTYAGMYLNGALSSETSSFGTIGKTSNTRAYQSNAFIGGFDYGSTADSDIAAFVYGADVTPSLRLRNRLEGWAAHRYGLTDNLPADHPYKEVAP